MKKAGRSTPLNPQSPLSSPPPMLLFFLVASSTDVYFFLAFLSCGSQRRTHLNILHISILEVVRFRTQIGGLSRTYQQQTAGEKQRQRCAPVSSHFPRHFHPLFSSLVAIFLPLPRRLENGIQGDWYSANFPTCAACHHVFRTADC